MDKIILENLRKQYPRNTRIVLDEMDDSPYNQNPPIGSQGTVQWVDDVGDIVPLWDEAGGLKVIYGVDKCHIVYTEQDAEASLEYFGKSWRWGCRCPRCGVESPDGHLYALSRRAKINICNACGMQEALESVKAQADIGKVYDTIPSVLGMLEWAFADGVGKIAMIDLRKPVSAGFLLKY